MLPGHPNAARWPAHAAWTLLVLCTPAAPPQARKPNAPLPMVTRGDVTAFELTPDGSRAVYLADPREDERHELFSVPMDGNGDGNGDGSRDGGSSSPIPLPPDVPPDADVEPGFRIASDGQRVVFRADLRADGVLELFNATTDGAAAPVQLNAPLAHNGDVDGRFAIAPDGRFAVFLADHSSRVATCAPSRSRRTRGASCSWPTRTRTSASSSSAPPSTPAARPRGSTRPCSRENGCGSSSSAPTARGSGRRPRTGGRAARGRAGLEPGGPGRRSLLVLREPDRLGGAG